MTPEVFERLYPPLRSWIDHLLSTHRSAARSIASIGFRRLPDYFSGFILEGARVVDVDVIPLPPLRELGLDRFSSMISANFVGITYLDTYFVRSDHFGSETLHFHELVHVVQWRLLGPEAFLKAYADGLERYGYRESPLEKIAHDLQDRFATPTDADRVRSLVRR
jgi:hypothetical protein